MNPRHHRALLRSLFDLGVDMGTVPPAQSVALVQASQLVGTATNDNAAAGRVGEFVTATVATPGSGLTTATTLNVASISLTAGDWDISTFVNFLMTGATGTLLLSGPSLTSTTLPTQAGGGGLGTDGLASNDLPTSALTGTMQQDSGPIRLSIAATTTVFLTAQATFSVGTISAFGTIRARRIR